MTNTYRNRPVRAGVGRLVAALAGTALLLAGCSNSDDVARPAAATTASFNEADVAFAQGMIPHHEQALTMAALAQKAGATAPVLRLAGEIEAAQDPEIALMRGWLLRWNRPTAMPAMDHSQMTGMTSDADLARLRALHGRAFDRLFLTLMRAHHLGAIEMARTEQREGSSLEAKALAQRIESAQAAEVKRIEALLAQ
ncbi:MAG TPA: DUF305 domain-containing protein [Sporichthya sp.]|nr:DUF305 domain-containing protein [Sporichthya sp.]